MADKPENNEETIGTALSEGMIAYFINRNI